MTFPPRSAVILAAVLVLAGCSSVPLEEKKPAAPAAVAVPPAAGAVAVPSASSSSAELSAIEKAKAALKLVQSSIFFPYDTYEVTADFDDVVTAYGNYLIADTSVRLMVEGHADDRGTPEYNLALGQKRSESVIARLRVMGVSADRLEAVSFGEEKPRAQGTDEAAYAENRRAELVLR